MLRTCRVVAPAAWLLALTACGGGTSEGDCATDNSMLPVYVDKRTRELAGCTFPSARTFGEITCRGGNPNEVKLWPNRRVYSCTIDAALQLAEVVVPASSTVRFYPDGVVEGYTVYNDIDDSLGTVTIRGEPCTRVTHWNDGSMRACSTKRSDGMGGWTGTLRCWDEKGELVSKGACEDLATSESRPDAVNYRTWEEGVVRR